MLWVKKNLSAWYFKINCLIRPLLIMGCAAAVNAVAQPIATTNRHLNSHEINTSLVDSALVTSAASNLKKNSMSSGLNNRYPLSGTKSLTQSLSATLELRQSDNGARTQFDEILERQDEINLNWALAYRGDWAHVSSQYHYRNEHFAEDSQDDDHFVVGDTLVNLRDASGAWGVNAGHTQRQVLQNDADTVTARNQQNREVVFAAPYGRLQLSPVTEIQLSVDNRKMEQERAADRNYDQRTIATDFLHRLDPISGVSINLGRTEQFYESNQYFDYDIKRASIRFWRNLRKWQYQAYVGANRVDTIGGEENRPLYGASLSITDATISLSLKFDSYITDVSDSSISDSFGYGFDWQLDNLGSQSVQRDRLHLRSVNYLGSITNQVLINWIWERDDYLSVDEEVTTNLYSAVFERKLRPRHTAYLELSNIDRAAKRNIFQNDENYYRYELGYKVHFAKRADLAAFIGNNGRGRESQYRYDEKIIGLRWYQQFR